MQLASRDVRTSAAAQCIQLFPTRPPTSESRDCGMLVVVQERGEPSDIISAFSFPNLRLLPLCE